MNKIIKTILCMFLVLALITPTTLASTLVSSKLVWSEYDGIWSSLGYSIYTDSYNDGSKINRAESGIIHMFSTLSITGGSDCLNLNSDPSNDAFFRKLDLNNDGKVVKQEAVDAVVRYFANGLSKPQAIAAVVFYFSECGVTALDETIQYRGISILHKGIDNRYYFTEPSGTIGSYTTLDIAKSAVDRYYPNNVAPTPDTRIIISQVQWDVLVADNEEYGAGNDMSKYKVVQPTITVSTQTITPSPTTTSFSTSSLIFGTQAYWLNEYAQGYRYRQNNINYRTYNELSYDGYSEIMNYGAIVGRGVKPQPTIQPTVLPPIIQTPITTPAPVYTPIATPAPVYTPIITPTVTPIPPPPTNDPITAILAWLKNIWDSFGLFSITGTQTITVGAGTQTFNIELIAPKSPFYSPTSTTSSVLKGTWGVMNTNGITVISKGGWTTLISDKYADTFSMDLGNNAGEYSIVSMIVEIPYTWDGVRWVKGTEGMIANDKLKVTVNPLATPTPIPTPPITEPTGNWFSSLWASIKAYFQW